jgi:hypothetical protein
VRKLIKIVLLIITGLTVLVAVLLFAAYRATQHEPDFYAEAMQADPANQEEAGDELERRVLDLHNNARHEGDWTAVFSDEQINGWLAVDLPTKHPRALPSGASDPRVAITDGQALLGCRYESKKLSTVVSLAVSVNLSEEENVLAIRISTARAGALPVPMKRWLESITKGARRAGVPLRWAQLKGDPVALVPILIRHQELKDRQLVIESIQLLDGEIRLAGRTEALADTGSTTETVQTAIYLPSSSFTIQR